MWYVPTMEYDSGIKRNKVLIHVITWINFEHMLSKNMLYDSIYSKCTE